MLDLAKKLLLKKRDWVYPFFWFDVIHGYKTISPIPLAESASWDMEAIKKIQRQSLRKKKYS
jgi:hypothetical protein